jgi:rfaE bifunctional protein nucleotidyltransferase chain/domain
VLADKRGMPDVPRPEFSDHGPIPLNPSGAPPVGGTGGASPKILSKAQLLATRRRLRGDGLTLVQCHGCFDIVHPGHIRHLRQAKSSGDTLLVSITGDAEMRKGVGRPLIPEELRAENLAALDFVDFVYIERRATALDLLDEVQPDVFVKGQEYEFNNDPRFKAERESVERHGGRVVFSSGDVVFSSTALVGALAQSADPYHARLVQLLADERLRPDGLGELVGSFRGKRVVVVGEPILDTYVACDRPGVAGESPVMTLRPLDRTTFDGGAAIIARHLAAMGARPVLVCALPDSAETDGLRRRLLCEGVEMRRVRADWAIPEKQRFLVGTQKVMKLDLVERLTLDATQQEELVALASKVAGEAGGADGAIIADFGLGLFTPAMLARLCRELRRTCRVVTGDVSGRRSNLRALRGLDLVTPSESEAREALGLFDDGLPTLAWRVLRELAAKNVILTMGAEGAVAFDRIAGDGPEREEATGEGGELRARVRSEHVPALCGYAVDPLGCGDSLLAAATLTLASGGSLVQAAFLGSVAAATQAQRLGNTVISAADVRQGVHRVHSAHLTLVAPDAVRTRPSYPHTARPQQASA